MTYNRPVCEKCDDRKSPAYLPIIFSFTSSSNRRKVECDIVRYGATKRERELLQDKILMKEVLTKQRT